MRGARQKGARTWIGAALLGLAAALALLGARWLWLDAPPSEHRYALSPQECNTQCQQRQTDCILACDGNVACEQRCTETGGACVERCRRAARADAGAAGSGGSGGSGGAGGRRP